MAEQFTIKRRFKRIAFIVAVGCTILILGGFYAYKPYGIVLVPLATVAWLAFAALSVDKLW